MTAFLFVACVVLVLGAVVLCMTAGAEGLATVTGWVLALLGTSLFGLSNWAAYLLAKVPA